MDAVRAAAGTVGGSWEAVAAAAARHRTETAVAYALRAIGWAGVPSAVRAGLTAHERAASLRALTQTGETGRIGGALSDAGIPFFTLKGPPLGLLLFDSLTMRQSKDIDLLVDPDRIVETVAILRSLGYDLADEERRLSPRQQRVYRRIERHSTFHGRGGQPAVECHWQLNADALFPFSAADGWADRLEVRIAGRSVPVLPPEILLVYLACHGGGHAWFRLKWLMDIAAILRRWDGAAIRAGWRLAERHGLLGVLGSSFVLARDLMAAPVPDDLLRHAAADPTADRLTRLARRAMAEDDMRRLSTIFWRSAFFMHAGWRYRLRHAARSLYAPSDWARYPLPDALFPLYFLMRPFTWLGRSRP
ncbi:MAG: nucleotidyltransferase family protein [Alphaproteobacteria bacterium]